MKTRKIWSIPIAALALVLMLAGALVATSVVQAQPASPSAPANVANTVDGTAVTGDTNLATILISNLPANAALTPPINADPSTDPPTIGFVNPKIASGQVMVDHDDDATSPTIPLFRIQADPDNSDTTADYAVRLGNSINQSHLTADSYALSVEIVYDLDTTKDGNDVGSGLNDDRDRTFTTAATIYVARVDQDVDFHVENSGAVIGATISEIGMHVRDDPQHFNVTGIGPNNKIAGYQMAGEGASNYEFFDMGGNEIGVRVKAVPGPTSDVSFTGNVWVDSDITEDAADDNDSNTTWDADGNTSNDRDITLEIPTNTIDVVAPLAITDQTPPPQTTPATPDDGYVVVRSIRDDVSAGHLVRTLAVTGAATVNDNGVDEDVDGVVSGDSRFDINDDLTIYYKGGGADLTEGETIELLVTINGDTGIANRTTSGKAKIMITGSNTPPTGTTTVSYTVAENDKTDTNLVKANTVVGDLNGLITDPDGGTITYTVKGDGSVAGSSTSFDVSGTDLVVKTAIAEPDPAIEDDPDTSGDETQAAVPPAGGKCLDANGLAGCGNVQYVFEVNASDGVESNDVTITVTVVIDVNEPVERVTDAADLPEGVTYTPEYEWDHDDDSETAALKVPVYSIYKKLADKDVPYTLFNISGIMSDSDTTDDLVSRAPDGTPSHIVLAQNGGTNGNVDITYLPPKASDTGGLPSFFEVTVDDGFNPDVDTKGTTDTTDDVDKPDQTVYLMITVEEEPAPPIRTEYLDITVVENTTTCTGDCTAAGEIEGGVSYKLESGTDIGTDDPATADVDERDYNVASDGTITVRNAPNYEDGKNPDFAINVKDADGETLGFVLVSVTITDVNEAPAITAPASDAKLYVIETAEMGDAVKVMANSDPAASDANAVVTTDDPENDTVAYGKKGKASASPFAVNSKTGAITVSGALDHETNPSYAITVTASDGTNDVEQSITIKVYNDNEAPDFTSPTGAAAAKPVAEDWPVSMKIFDFTAEDPDGNDLVFTLRQGQSEDLFVIKNAVKTGMNATTGASMYSGELHAKPDDDDATMTKLDFEGASFDGRVHVEVNDPQGLNDTLLLTVNLTNVNDESPVIGNKDGTQSVKENSERGTPLGDYSATDRDNLNQPGFDTIAYTLEGDDAKHFDITAAGMLVTHASLDYDSSTPCGTCEVTVVATDNAGNKDTQDVVITVEQAEDSVSTVHVTKANPVPGTGMGDVMSALAGTKSTMVRVSDGKVAAMESPGNLPNASGPVDANGNPANFVETEWGNWGTVLRIEVTAESPDAKCDGGNRCVVVTVASDSGDDTLKLKAYRSASQENKFVAAVRLVEVETDATPGTDAVYMHPGGGVAALYVDEEDEVEIEFGNLRSSVDVENEIPEISNFAPAHETAFDDADVDYTFSVTDDNSGLPEAEDLPDSDGDKDYNPVVALISKAQCASYGPNDTVPAKMNPAAMVESDKTLYCPGTESSGEFVAGNGDAWGFAPIRDDKDFDETDNGVDVETTVVLTENAAYYVTFIACDNAGNCTFYDPDSNDDMEELAQVTVDVDAPDFVEARTGLTWDTSDLEYDDNRSFIQVIFNELTQINPATVEIDDFVVEGHSIKEVHVFDPDQDDIKWADSGRYAEGSSKNYRQRGSADYGSNWYQDIANSVFLELEDELLADEEPQVSLVPNGIEDAAGKEQDDGEKDADDWISPKFTIVSIVSPRETSQSQVLAGDDDEVVVTVTSDERLDSTRPEVMVNRVIAPDGSVDTKGTAACTNADGSDGTRERGEIVNNSTCQDSAAAKDSSELNTTIEKVSNTEWIVTITEPKKTGYHNFYISGQDRSKQENPGSEGVKPDNIVVDFFDADGDVNVDDAVFFEGDRNLPKPNVRVSGEVVTDNEANVEFRSPLFVELDFTKPHSDNCRNKDNEYMMANCMAETKEYAKDNFDSVTITMFELDGVDMTDMVKTTDDETFLISLDSIALGDHTAKVQAVDQAGNTLEDTLEIDFEVDDRDPFEKRLSPGWNLVSLPGAPADSSIATVFGSSVEVRTVYTYDPVVPGGWQVAVRETLDSDWQGDLTEITGQRGYWVLSDAIQDWEVNIPRLAGGAAGTGTPIQPPSIALYAGWNLIPVTDVTGDGDAGDGITVKVYLNSLDDGLDLARVLGFDTIRNEWMTLGNEGMVEFGKGYWVFVREAGTLVPGQ